MLAEGFKYLPKNLETLNLILYWNQLGEFKVAGRINKYTPQ